jgi:8-oxo-dGTP pyrophosphatase MutT (NUDIX family)
LEQFIESIKQKLQEPLPGLVAQLQMAGALRAKETLEAMDIPKQARRAAVMILFHQQENDRWKTVLIKRSVHPNDRHSGQISFPGGSVQTEDNSLEATALRELEEEVGIPSGSVEVVGGLTELYIPVSNFVVHPFVGVLKDQPTFRPQPGEVEQILVPEMECFYHPNYRKRTDLRLSTGYLLPDMPYFDVDGHIVWGATAMMMSELTCVVDSDLLGIRPH